MVKPRGRQHTTLTETAQKVVRIIQKHPGIKMIAPGEIAPTRSRSQRITITCIKAGLALSVCGNGIQKVAIHTSSPQIATSLADVLKSHPDLQEFTISERVREPGV